MSLRIEFLGLLLFLFSFKPSVTCQNTAGKMERTVQEKLIGKVDMEQVVNNSFSTSTNLRRIAYRIHEDKKEFAVIDGLKSSAYDSVGAPVFSPDGSRTAYSARQGTKWMIILDGKPI